METPNRIIGVKVWTTVHGRDVTVAFRSPYRWRIFENEVDVTKSFGHALRGPSLPPHSEAWQAFHDETRLNERKAALQCAA
ncbi:hypothetical protein [Sphingopyxis macrogoltabida]|uniref:Uncharacterized protein n=1 Tax=Sphingopyxis macrogoltabida TaxID=33050 RepID=A0AAC9AVB3_SPHMC|nr:hypothetical protein [Sphingopyxis macrogoltabida]ALJ12665.1 hypothetical protein LH19_07275 [Sphingopyxis macrogoltabida]AMU89867.1 hypothetical protein ATM17_12560 [Sphingopyxis macrogoltabida]